MTVGLGDDKMDNDCDDMRSVNQEDLNDESPRVTAAVSDNRPAKSSGGAVIDPLPYEIDISYDIIENAPVFSDEDICEILNPMRQVNAIETSGAWTTAVRERLYEFSRIKSDSDAVFGVLSIMQIATTLYDYQREVCNAPLLKGVPSTVFGAILKKLSIVCGNEQLITDAFDHAKQKGLIEHVLISNATLSMDPPSGYQEIAALSIQGRSKLGVRFTAFHMTPIVEDEVSDAEISEERNARLKGSGFPDYKNPSKLYLLAKAANLLGFKEDLQNFRYLIDSCDGEMAVLYRPNHAKKGRKWIFNLDHDLVPKGTLEPYNPKS